MKIEFLRSTVSFETLMIGDFFSHQGSDEIYQKLSNSEKECTFQPSENKVRSTDPSARCIKRNVSIVVLD